MPLSYDPYVSDITSSVHEVTDSEFISFEIKNKDSGLMAHCKLCNKASSRLSSTQLKDWMREHVKQSHDIKLYKFTCAACPVDVLSFEDFESLHNTEADAIAAREEHIQSTNHQINSEEKDYFSMPPPDADEGLPIEFSLPNQS